jgi:hypothetical protein
MKNTFLLTITVETDRTAADTVETFQKFFDYYHPSLKAKVGKAQPVAAPIPEKPAAEDLL